MAGEKTTAIADLEKVAQEIRVVVDVDQRFDQLDLRHPRLEQILELLYGVLLGVSFETCEPIFSFAVVDRQRWVEGSPRIDASGHGVQALFELFEVHVAVDRQPERRVVLLPLRRPGIPWDEVLLEVSPAARTGHRDIA
jgi:hypothetical protein